MDVDVDVDARGSGGARTADLGARGEGAVAGASEAVPRAVVRPSPEVDRRLRYVEHSGDLTGPFEYEVLEPDDATATTPLVIALHGMGDTTDGFARFVRALRLRARVFIARGPVPYGITGGRQWYVNEADDAIKQVRVRASELAELAGRIARLHPEAGKPALLGFSQGAAIALQATLEFPDAFRAVAALSGFIPSEAGAKAPTGVVPILVVAGDKDETVPQKLSWFAAGALARYGHRDVRKLSFDGPHTIPREVRDAVQAFFGEVLAAP